MRRGGRQRAAEAARRHYRLAPDAQPDIVLVLLPGAAKSLPAYDAFKRAGDCQQGVLTQCLLAGKSVLKPGSNQQ